MAIDRGTRMATFVHIIEMFATIGTLGGAAYGVYGALGGTPFELLMAAIRPGVMGFIGGAIGGAVIGALAVLLRSVSR